MQKNYATISLFVYKRTSHLQITIDSLKKNSEAKNSWLYIFFDHWRSEQDKKASVFGGQKIYKCDIRL